jgi:hypothetical protein
MFRPSGGLTKFTVSSTHSINLSLSGLNSQSMPQAIVVRVDGRLECFEHTGGGLYERMTIQDGFQEGAMQFESTIDSLALKCIPEVLSKLVTADMIYVAVIDTDMEWTLNDLFEARDALRCILPQKSPSRSVAVRTFIADDAEDIVPYPGDLWEWEPEQGRLRNSGRRDSAKLIPRRPSINSQTHRSLEGDSVLSISSLEDVPAEFDHVVWMRAQFDKEQSDSSRSAFVVRLFRKGEVLTTLEAAQKMFPKPDAAQLLFVYRMLRSAHRKSLTVPMVGFEDSFLSAQSYLSQDSDVEDIHINLPQLLALRHRRYFPSDIAPINKKRLPVSARRCLGSAFQGLDLFDLTEDILCDLNGATQFNLSLADVWRVHSALS